MCAKPHALINVTIEGGKEIQLDKIYLIGTIKFMMLGGDDFADVLNFYTPRNFIYYDNVREVIGEYIKEIGMLNTNKKRFIDPNNRRLIVHDCKKLEMPTLYKEYLE